MSTVSKSSEPQLDREALAALYEETFKKRAPLRKAGSWP
jgi:hypothetical protein